MYGTRRLAETCCRSPWIRRRADAHLKAVGVANPTRAVEQDLIGRPMPMRPTPWTSAWSIVAVVEVRAGLNFAAHQFP